ncbi:relaxase/mobilization nuclease-like protein [Spirosoma oryzae]|uniref:Relaxase/mobilization nuclease-like protein n=1 Tax=Spirosoma oryzae TaxID=1469603 RepID=A0A2T0S310_9BACT|nr:relaxase/mobilization nuclease domain-containing protein [Spirosoma oryzae]PRY27808.1 relaxase/mobilization nuclease-like protein [Spirosoma oryzae]
MIVRINKGKNVSGAVRYNENKVEQGEARLIGAPNYYAPADELSLRAKVGLLQAQAGLNPRVTQSALHVPIAFHPSEDISDEKMIKIAGEWMQRMNYGEQPYLVYRHEDTAHPHMHIVSVTVDEDGKRISDSNEKYRSNAIRKDIEINYKLIKAEDQEKVLSISSTLPENAIHYGKEQTKKAIGNVVQTALKDYNFSRLDEFAQFLASYNVQVNVSQGKRSGGADWHGISFQLTNGERPLSPSIKASTYSFAPTYEKIQNRLKSGQKKKLLHEPAVRKTIDGKLQAFASISQADYAQTLRQAGIQLLDTGKQFYYVDHTHRTVYSESDLGKPYSRAFLNNRFADVSVIHTPVEQRSAPEAVVAPARPIPSVESTAPLTDRQRAELGRMVSGHYQDYKQRHNVFFESQLIRNFPVQPLIDTLQAAGRSETQARLAVTEFERHKQSQLADIRSRETDYFEKTSQAYLDLVSQTPIHPESRLQLLSALNLTLTLDKTGKYGLVHQHGAEYRYELTDTQHTNLLKSSSQQKVALGRPFSKEERTVLLAAATGQPLKGTGISQVNVALLRSILPAAQFAHVSQSLNQHYLTQLSLNRPDQQRLWPGYYYQRGMVISGPAGDQRIGFYATPQSSHVPLPEEVQQLLKTAPLQASYGQAVDKLTSQAGRLLIRYNQTLDQPASERQRQQLQSVLSDFNQQFPAAAGLDQKGRIRYLNDQLNQIPVKTPVDGRSTTTAGETSRTGLPANVERILNADLLAYRTSQQIRYESSLLATPAGFPTARLVSLLCEPGASASGLNIPAGISRQLAENWVSQFQQKRIDQLPNRQQSDQQAFEILSRNLLARISQSRLPIVQRLEWLTAMGLQLTRIGDQGGVLSQKGDSRIRVSIEKTTLNLLLTPPLQPTNDKQGTLSRSERQLYEYLAIGKPISALPAGIDWSTINANRVRQLTPAQDWDALCLRLNQLRVDRLMKTMQEAPPYPVTWLYQRGLITYVDAAGGLRLGHPASPPATFVTLVNPVRLIVADLPLPALADQIQQQTSERGRTMVRLAALIDGGKAEAIAEFVHKLAGKSVEWQSLSGQPQAMLERLSRTNGPLVVESSVSVNNRPEGDRVQTERLADVETTQSTDNLGKAITDGMDTSQERPKKRRPGHSEPRHRPKLR